MQTRRQRTNQDAQRAKHTRKRRRRGPPEAQHGARSQSGVKIRSTGAWKTWTITHRMAITANRRLDELKAGWRERARAKRAA